MKLSAKRKAQRDKLLAEPSQEVRFTFCKHVVTWCEKNNPCNLRYLVLSAEYGLYPACVNMLFTNGWWKEALVMYTKAKMWNQLRR